MILNSSVDRSSENDNVPGATYDEEYGLCHLFMALVEIRRDEGSQIQLTQLPQSCCYKGSSPGQISNLVSSKISSWTGKRKEVTQLPKLQKALQLFGLSRNRSASAQEIPQKRKRCHIYPARLNRRTVELF